MFRLLASAARLLHCSCVSIWVCLVVRCCEGLRVLVVFLVLDFGVGMGLMAMRV